MKSPDSSDEGQAGKRLLAHADGLYTVAHALTMNAVEASALVEAVFRRAARERIPADANARSALLRMLREEAGMSGDSRVWLASGPAPTGDFRRQLGDRAVKRVLPLAFASLARHEREVLILHVVERIPIDEVSELIERDASLALETAEASLRTEILSQLGRGERGLVDFLPDGWLRDAVNELAVTEIPALPPSLRNSIEQPLLARRTQGEVKNRSQERRSRSSISQGLQRALAVASIVFFAGLVGYVVSRIMDAPPETNVIAISAAASDRARVEVSSADPADVEAFIRERTGLRLQVPQIEGASLIGARVTEPSPGIRVPTLIYSDVDNGGRIVVLAYTYALIDSHGESLRFERETLEQIQEEGRYELHDLGGKQVLVWRHRNAIFVAVTEGQADALYDRVYRSS
jgi:DNA-directed RNA polymerase specialized sigma24 family protein